MGGEGTEGVWSLLILVPCRAGNSATCEHKEVGNEAARSQQEYKDAAWLSLRAKSLRRRDAEGGGQRPVLEAGVFGRCRWEFREL